MTVEVHDSPAERARCIEICALEFDAEGDQIHAAECRSHAAELIPKQVTDEPER